MSKKVAPDENLVRIVHLLVPRLEVLETTPSSTGHINQTFRIRYKRESKEGSFLLQNLNTHVLRDPEAVMHTIVRCSKITETLGDAYPMQILRPQVLSDESSYLYQIGRAHV